MKTTLAVFILLWRPLWSSSVCCEDHSGRLHPPMKITLVIFIVQWRPLLAFSVHSGNFCGYLHLSMKTTRVIFIGGWRRPKWTSSCCEDGQSGLHCSMKMINSTVRTTKVIFTAPWRQPERYQQYHEGTRILERHKNNWMVSIVWQRCVNSLSWYDN